MKFATYANNCVPAKWTILGLTLKPLSLGHYILMKRLECGYASDEDTNVNITDLITGVLICSMTYEEFVEFMESPDFEKEIKLWGKKFSKQVKKEKNFNLFDKFVSFKQYLTEGTQMPLFWETDSTGKPSGCHWSLSVHNVLIGPLGFTNKEALNMPLNQAFAHYFKYLESQGAVELMSPQEEDLIKGEPCQN